MIHNNNPLKESLQNFIQSKITELVKVPELDIIQIGKNLASTKYIGVKQKIAQILGLRVNVCNFAEEDDSDKVQKIINLAAKSKRGLIVQLPVPPKFRSLVDDIPSQVDVDLLGKKAVELWNAGVLPPTIQAIDLTLKDIFKQNLPKRVSDLSSTLNQNFIDYRLDLSGLNVVVIGRGKLVGSPAIKYAMDRGATLISIEKSTVKPEKLCGLGDIIISAAGQKNLLQSDWVKPGAIVIDASTSESAGTLVGDVPKEELGKKTILSPSPGGIGGLTVLCLFYNLVAKTIRF